MQPKFDGKMLFTLLFIRELINCLHPEKDISFCPEDFDKRFPFKAFNLTPRLSPTPPLSTLITAELAEAFRENLNNPQLREILGCQHCTATRNVSLEKSYEAYGNTIAFSLLITGVSCDTNGYILYDEKDRIKKWIAVAAFGWLLPYFNSDEAQLKKFITQMNAHNDSKTAWFNYLKAWSATRSLLQGEKTPLHPSDIVVRTSSSIGEEHKKAVTYFHSSEGKAKLEEMLQRGLFPLPEGNEVLNEKKAKIEEILRKGL